MNKLSKIILVDDDEDDQLIFKSVVKEILSDIDCTCFDNALLSIKSLQEDSEQKPDCIFLDLNLPFMHGFEFLARLKSLDSYSNIPVIIYSTSSRDADKIKAKELGAANFLSKPASYQELKDKLSNILSSYFCRP